MSPISLNELVASRKDQLQRINDAGLVDQGRVFLMSLEPVKAQIGARWPNRQDVIWEAVERALAKSMPPPDAYVRLNDTTVLVAIASAASYEGQVRCVEVLRTLLSYFLGRSADADIGLSRISSMGNDTLSADPVDIAAVPIAPAAQPPPVRQQRSPEDWTPPLTQRRSSGTVWLTHHGETAYELDVVPVWRLDQDTVSSYAIRLTLPEGLPPLTDRDHEALSHRTIEHLLPILEDYRSEGGTFAIIVPIAFSALSARRPRLALLNRCAAFKDIMRRAVVAEISDFHAGVPTGLFRETVAMIKPFFRVVTATIQTTSDVSALYKEAAIHGVAVQWPSVQRTDMNALFRIARRRTPNIIVHRAPDMMSADQLRLLQASHLTWKDAGRR